MTILCCKFGIRHEIGVLYKKFIWHFFPFKNWQFCQFLPKYYATKLQNLWKCLLQIGPPLTSLVSVNSIKTPFDLFQSSGGGMETKIPSCYCYTLVAGILKAISIKNEMAFSNSTGKSPMLHPFIIMAFSSVLYHFRH